MKKNKKPKVSICCITYNHKTFIRDAIEGFLMQKTNFPFEIIIHDDASTDGTAEIVREYAKKHPDLIVPILQEENQYSKGIRIPGTIVFPKARGKYIAVCEGDDYWTDPLKLQKQFDFMEENNDYNICFTYSKKFFVKKGIMEKTNVMKRKEYTHNDILVGKRNDTRTCTSFFRKKILKNERLWPYYLKSPAGDLFVKIMGTYKSKAIILPYDTAIYRKHDGGVWTSLSFKERVFFKIKIEYQVFRYSFRYNKIISLIILKNLLKFIMTGGK